MTDSERRHLEEILPIKTSSGDAGRKDTVSERLSGLDEIGDMTLIEELLIGSDLDFSTGRDLDWALPEFLDDDFDMLADAFDGPDPSVQPGAETGRRQGGRDMLQPAAKLESAADRRAALDEILALPGPALLRARKAETDRSALESILPPLSAPAEVPAPPVPQSAEVPLVPVLEAVRAEPDPRPPAPPAVRDGLLRGLMRRAGIGLGDTAAAAPASSAAPAPHIRRT